jgi:hypothetical protein
MVKNIDLRPTFEDTPRRRAAWTGSRSCGRPRPARRSCAGMPSPKVSAARSWRAVYDADQACHIWGNGVQGYYEVTADRCQLESTPDYSHVALMHPVLVRMKDCDDAECRVSGP